MLKMIQDCSFILEDGYLFMSNISFIKTMFYSNNSIEVNLLECVEKEKFLFDKLDTCNVHESESAAGKIA